MYKFLLCWRYLKTRYLAMACIISVMLGVATLIVVNSVMSGFSTKLRETLHGVLSDVVIEGRGMEGFGDPGGKMDKIRNDPFLGPRIEAMAATLEVFAMLQYQWPNGETVTRPVRLVGVDPRERGLIPGFKEFLEHPDNKANPSFNLPADRRQAWIEREERVLLSEQPRLLFEEVAPDVPPPPMPTPKRIKIPQGAIVGNLIAHLRLKKEPGETERREQCLLQRGDSIILTTVSGQKLAPVYDRFVVVDYYKSEMSEYDGNYVFVQLDYLQHLRTMHDRVTSIQIKLRDYDADAKQVVEALHALFPADALFINTWEDKQGPLLAAISIEKGILNILLFLIVAVAGFGILAIFSMIVAEKTRDIGILKALGASNAGVMKIFLSYGLLLGVVGAGLGTLLGVWLTVNVNKVERFLTELTGKEVFDRSIYYFNEIPTDLQVSMLLMVNLGAIAIATLFSVLPALRAALLQPVRALRYE